MPESWKPSNWDALVNGTSCPVCDLLQTAQHEDEYGIAAGDLTFSRLFLAKNQYVPGYCVLMCHKHVIEPYELTDDERRSFFDDMAVAAQGLQTIFGADKMNYNILGNVVPHLHVHLLPRYFTDRAPHRPIDPAAEHHFLSTGEYTERIRMIQERIGAVGISGLQSRTGL